MKVFYDIDAWSAWRRSLSGEQLGFVPTMGALHAGHESLVARSLGENERTVVSIFVNPTQFDQAADLEAYPVSLTHDLEKLSALGVDAVLAPAAEALYPDGYRYRVTESQLSRDLCGAHRPGHFDGVLTVVMKLFNIVKPRRAYFGEKDYQQLLLVRGMAEAFFLPTEIIACPTVRDSDGLALSSRNRRLNGSERLRAPRLLAVITQAESPEEAEDRLREEGFVVDYVRDLDGRRLVAARLGATRLIDNIPLVTSQDVAHEA